MTRTTSLDGASTQDVVDQLAYALGQGRAAEVLGVTPGRFEAMLSGRGRMSEHQTMRVAALTRRTWPLWLLDGLKRRARTGRQRELYAAAQVMRDHYERVAPDEISRAEAVLQAADGPDPAGAGPTARPQAPRRRRARPAA